MAGWWDENFPGHGQWDTGTGLPMTGDTGDPNMRYLGGSPTFDESAAGASAVSNPMSGSLLGSSTPDASIDALKQLVGGSWDTAHLQQLLPQLKAMGVEVQNQSRGDLRPRFRLPNGDQWDFGPGGWVHSGSGVSPGFGDPSQAPAVGGGPTTGGGGGLLGGDMQGWLGKTPGYQFALNQGIDAIQKSAAARGTLLTGGTLKGIAQYASGLADQTYGNQYDRYLRLLGLGMQGIGTGSS